MSKYSTLPPLPRGRLARAVCRRVGSGIRFSPVQCKVGCPKPQSFQGIKVSNLLGRAPGGGVVYKRHRSGLIYGFKLPGINETYRSRVICIRAEGKFLMDQHTGPTIGGQARSSMNMSNSWYHFFDVQCVSRFSLVFAFSLSTRNNAAVGGETFLLQHLTGVVTGLLLNKNQP